MKFDISNEELDTKDLILKSARKIFLEYGYQAAPLRKIALEAGYTHGALYGYFGSKEELFYAITDPIARQLMNALNEIQNKMRSIPKEKRLYEMGSIYYKNIPRIVDVLLSDRVAIDLIVNGSKGTKYEGFIDNISKRNAVNINMAAENAEDKELKSIKDETMEMLMDGYIRTLFRLVLSDKPRETIIQCMEMIGKIYEAGIISIMKKEDYNGN